MRALLSVSDKTGIVEFAKELESLGFEIVSTGGTYEMLQENGISVTGISEITGIPEFLDGRIKTLHPAVYAGILAKREVPEHMAQLDEQGIDTIDIVAINLYPFKETIMRPDVTLPLAIENIDIGGPAMLRSAAKNHRDVTVICDPVDYTAVAQQLREGGVTDDMRYRLALKVFQHTAAYDAMISEYMRQQIGAELPDNLTLTFEKTQGLRYGENPHQTASYYKEIRPYAGALVNAEQLHGKELSYNNINDANGAIELLKEFCSPDGDDKPAVVAVKHANPCGAAVGDSLLEAYEKTYECDPVSIFGGIIACNRPVDKDTAAAISRIFFEILIAPDFDQGALDILEKKQNVRLLKLPAIGEKGPDDRITVRKVTGGLLVQNEDVRLIDEDALKVVTRNAPTDSQMEDLRMAMKIVKHTKSNAVVFVKDGQSIGIGLGQTNRIWAVQNAIRQANIDIAGSVMASDAFFPFSDCVAAAGEAGVVAIIQPGGSIRDQESIDKADELGIAMVFSGLRHFKH